MENMKSITTEEAKEAVGCIVRSVKVTLAICDVEYPGSKELCLDVLIKELEKLRSERTAIDVSNGVCANAMRSEKACVKTPDPAVDLIGTVPLMKSDDYKERFKAEYYQTKIRYDKLHTMCVKHDAGTLDFTPTCPINLLREQKAAMGQYLNCLEVRAEIEDIKL